MLRRRVAMNNKKRLIILLLIGGGIVVTASITGYMGYRQYRLRELESETRELVTKRDSLKSEIAEKRERLKFILKTPGGMYSQARLLTKDGNMAVASDDDLRQADILYNKLINSGHFVEKSKEALKPIQEERANSRLNVVIAGWPSDMGKASEDTIYSIGLDLNSIIETYPETEG